MRGLIIFVLLFSLTASADQIKSNSVSDSKKNLKYTAGIPSEVQAPKIWGFSLKFTDCKIMGLSNKNKIEALPGDTGTGKCQQKKDITYSCEFSASGAVEDYEIGFIDEIGFGNSESGNVKIFLEMKERIFQLGMTTLTKNGVIMSKNCVGKIEVVLYNSL